MTHPKASNLLQFTKKWFQSSERRIGPDILLGQAPQPSNPLRQRIDWVRALGQWIQNRGSCLSDDDIKKDRIQIVRLRYILQVLDHNPHLKLQVAETLRSIIRDTRALELFMNTGIPNPSGFIAECVERLSLFLLPQPPHDQDLISVFTEMFQSEKDTSWFAQMSPQLIDAWIDLFYYAETPIDSSWNSLIQDAKDAASLMSHSIRSIGLSRLVRNRVNQTDFRELPFFRLTEKVEKFLNLQDQPSRRRSYLSLHALIQKCLLSVDEVYAHLNKNGVSISLVYQLQRLRALLHRLDKLIRLLSSYQDNSKHIHEFFYLLIRENRRSASLRSLLEDNLTLMSQTMLETTAEIGEQYITRTISEQRQIFMKSIGGGVLTAFTILIKFLLSPFRTAPFVSGLFAFTNYSVSFIGLQLLGFTLATKQPAMTATTLASKIKEYESHDGLIEEIIDLFRSQITAVAGNVIGVIPIVILIDSIFYGVIASHLSDLEYAEHTIESFSILGATPFYAACTGVFLWMSSVFAGYVDNWFNYRGLKYAIQHHPKLNWVIGKHRAENLSNFFKAQIAGLAASVSLGFLLAMVPKIAIFLGLPIDVRHVTLSTGSLVAAVLVIGPKILLTSGFWLAVAGIGSMAVLNLGVSFALALAVALRAKKAAAPRWSILYTALFKAIAQNPLSLLTTRKKSNKVKPSSFHIRHFPPKASRPPYPRRTVSSARLPLRDERDTSRQTNLDRDA